MKPRSARWWAMLFERFISAEDPLSQIGDQILAEWKAEQEARELQHRMRGGLHGCYVQASRERL